jgi:hypothetical protein
VAAEERIDLQALAPQRLGHRRVVQQGDDPIGVRPDRYQGIVQAAGLALGLPHERLHRRLAERGGVGAGEPAAEPLGSGDRDGRAVEADGGGGAVEHDNARVLEEPDHLGDPPGVVVVVPQHGDDRDLHTGELAGHGPGLDRLAATGEVAGQQQQVRPLVDVPQPGRDPTHRIHAHVDVCDGRNAHHVSSSIVASSSADRTVISFTTS